METTTKIAQECERCHKKKILSLDILQDKWLCDDCFIKSYCEDCGDLLGEFARKCLACAYKDHLKDIAEGLPDALAR